MTATSPPFLLPPKRAPDLSVNVQPSSCLERNTKYISFQRGIFLGLIGLVGHSSILQQKPFSLLVMENKPDCPHRFENPPTHCR